MPNPLLGSVHYQKRYPMMRRIQINDGDPSVYIGRDQLKGNRKSARPNLLRYQTETDMSYDAGIEDSYKYRAPKPKPRKRKPKKEQKKRNRTFLGINKDWLFEAFK